MGGSTRNENIKKFSKDPALNADINKAIKGCISSTKPDKASSKKSLATPSARIQSSLAKVDSKQDEAQAKITELLQTVASSLMTGKRMQHEISKDIDEYSDSVKKVCTDSKDSFERKASSM
jgi:hypothetical protein